MRLLFEKRQRGKKEKEEEKGRKNGLICNVERGQHGGFVR